MADAVSLVNQLMPTHRKKVMASVIEREQFGYSFDNAHASLEILIARLVDGKRLPFTVTRYHVSMRGCMSGDETAHICEANVRVIVGGAEYHEVSEGSGPVHALDGAIRLALNKSSLPSLDAVRLIDYSVGLVSGATTGTNAKTRVFITTTTGKTTWKTTGVSENIVEASLLALIDSLEYAFMVRMRT